MKKNLKRSNSVNEKDLQKFPFAVCVWAAPRQPCPIVERLRERLGAESQPHRFALQTDDHLRVLVNLFFYYYLFVKKTPN